MRHTLLVDVYLPKSACRCSCKTEARRAEYLISELKNKLDDMPELMEISDKLGAIEGHLKDLLDHYQGADC
jgi:hypothetical protein